MRHHTEPHVSLRYWPRRGHRSQASRTMWYGHSASVGVREISNADHCPNTLPSLIEQLTAPTSVEITSALPTEVGRTMCCPRSLPGTTVALQFVPAVSTSTRPDFDDKNAPDYLRHSFHIQLSVQFRLCLGEEKIPPVNNGPTKPRSCLQLRLS
jgi:hypothetical protein